MRRISTVALPFILLVVSLAAHAKEDMVKYNGQPMRHGFGFGKIKRTIVGVNDEASIKSGEKLYKKYCHACHGKDADSKGPVAKSFKLDPPSLKKLSKKFPNHHFFMQISEGPGDMPTWKDILAERQMWDLTNYIQSLANKK